MHVPVARIPEQDRPRERLARHGVAALTDAELVALVIRSGGPGTSAVAAGQGLLAEHGGLVLLARAPVEVVAQCPGMGSAKALSLVATFELGRRAASSGDLPASIRDASDIAALIRRHILVPER